MAYTRTNWENGKTPLKQNLQKIDDELETLDQNKADKSELANINLTNYYNKTEVDNKVANIPVVDTSNLETKRHITFKDWLPSTQYYKGDLIQGITMQDGGHNIWCLAIQDFVSSSINLDQDIFVYNVFAFMFYDANQDDGIGSGGVNIYQLEQRLALKADADYFNNIVNALGMQFDQGVGSVSNLTTADKSTIVNAINEINAKAGIAGQDGKSAYQIWLDAGNVGTINDYLISLKGAKGDKGDKGDIGLTGPQGPAGQDGVTPDISNLATKSHVEYKTWTTNTQYYTGDLIKGNTDYGYVVYCESVANYTSGAMIETDLTNANLKAKAFYVDGDIYAGGGVVSYEFLIDRLNGKLDVSYITNNIGTTSTLSTTNKVIVPAINELYNDILTGLTDISNALN